MPDPDYRTSRARLAPSLINLFREIDARWPLRGRGVDGWIGDAAHQARQSDHNPDSRGIVHAIDITRSQWTWQEIVQKTTRNDRPSSYVIHAGIIWSRSRNWIPRGYTGDNPHTNHIHVSILSGDQWESDTWKWDIADLGKGTGAAPRPGATGEFDDWRNWFDSAGGWNNGAASNFSQATLGITTIFR